MLELKKIISFFSPSKEREKEVPVLSLHYKGTDIFYSEGTSLIKRIIDNGDYEPEVSDAILECISGIPAPVFVDIGANIGLISAAVLNGSPNVKIFAFEPGPHQYMLFKKTIAENHLEEKIMISDIALSNKKGEAKFKIHLSSDASGDGFIDTERAGPTRTIKVKTDTLDNWWLGMGKPAVNFLKMDTEGSEYYILDGARQLLQELRPKMLIEINLQNIRNYPFSAEDLFKRIDSLGYNVFSLGKERITEANRDAHMKKTDTFLLLPA
jgi:FkbM family methyltransferase